MTDTLNYITLGKRIQFFRSLNQLSRNQLAELCQISYTHLHYIELGKRAPSLDIIFKISCILHVSIDNLCRETFPETNMILEAITINLQKVQPAKQRQFIRFVQKASEHIDEL